MKPHARILAVADRDAGPGALIEALRGRAGRPRVTLLVPAVPRGTARDGSTLVDWSLAIERADRWAERIRGAGLELEEAIVGDPDPALAAGDALHARRFDEVIGLGEAAAGRPAEPRMALAA